MIELLLPAFHHTIIPSQGHKRYKGGEGGGNNYRGLVIIIGVGNNYRGWGVIIVEVGKSGSLEVHLLLLLLGINTVSDTTGLRIL